jgi:hypothetical protein
MVDVKELMESKWLRPEDVENSTSKKGVILNTEIGAEGKYGKALKMSIQIDGKDKLYTPNKASLKNLSEAWGTESSSWHNKIMDFQLCLLQGGKKGIIATSNKE